MPRKSTSATFTRGDLLGAFEEMPLTIATIGTALLVPMPVMKDKDVFPVVPREAYLSAPDVKRSPRSGFSRSDFEMDEGSWNCLEYGHEEPWVNSEANLYRDAFDYERVLANRGRVIVERRQEMRIAAALHNTTTFPLAGNTGHNCSNAWSSSSGDPIADVATGVRGIRARTGLTPNLLQISNRAWWDLSRLSTILDRLKYTMVPGTRVPLQDLANVLGVPRIVVADATYNSANEGQTGTVAEIWSSTYAFLAVVATGMDFQQPCVGRTFYNQSDFGLMTVEQYHEDEVDIDWYRARQKVDNQVISSDFGYLIGNCA